LELLIIADEVSVVDAAVDDPLLLHAVAKHANAAVARRNRFICLNFFVKKTDANL